MSDMPSLPKTEIDRVFPCPHCADLSDPATRIVSEGQRHTYFLRCRLCGHVWEVVTAWPSPPRQPEKHVDKFVQPASGIKIVKPAPQPPKNQRQ